MAKSWAHRLANHRTDGSAAVAERIQVAAVEGVAEQRPTNAHRGRAGGQPLTAGVEVDPAGRDGLQLGKRTSQMLEIPRADRLCGKDLDSSRAGPPTGRELSRSQPAWKYRNLAFDGEPDHRQVHGRSDQEPRAAFDGTFGVRLGEDGADTNIGRVLVAVDEVG